MSPQPGGDGLRSRISVLPRNVDSRLNIDPAAMKQRPLSPHLQVYRLPITAWMSIAHRSTGIVLAVGALFLALVPLSIASGAESFGTLRSFLESAAGRFLLWTWILSFLLHLCHGVRHLLWDVGWGYTRENLGRYAALELAAILLLTGSVWLASHGSP